MSLLTRARRALSSLRRGVACRSDSARGADRHRHRALRRRATRRESCGNAAQRPRTSTSIRSASSGRTPVQRLGLCAAALCAQRRRSPGGHAQRALRRHDERHGLRVRRRFERRRAAALARCHQRSGRAFPPCILDILGFNDNIIGNVGIESTPVIDVATNTMYLVARTEQTDTASAAERNRTFTPAPACARHHDVRRKRPGSPVMLGGSVARQSGRRRQRRTTEPLTFDPNDRRPALEPRALERARLHRVVLAQRPVPLSRLGHGLRRDARCSRP